MVGVEIVPEAADKARSRDSYETVVTGDIIDPDVMSQIDRVPFDFILFGDVLEHLVDPRHALRTVSRLLADGGRVLVCVPNIVHWSIRLRVLFGRFDYTATGILDRTHLRFYTPSTLEEMVTSADMQIVSASGVVWLPSPLNRLPKSINRAISRIAGKASPGLFFGQTLLELAPMSAPSSGAKAQRFD